MNNEKDCNPNSMPIPANDARTTIQFIVFLLIILVAPSCKSRSFVDATQQIIQQPLEVPEAEYRSVAWLDNEHIAFSYRQEDFGERESARRIGLFTLTTEEWKDIPLPALPEKCYPAPSGIRHLSRLPNGNLSFIQHCHGNHVSAKLYIWEQRADAVREFVTYDSPFRAGRYAFAPDMSELIQEDSGGGGFNNSLYRIKPANEPERLLAGFLRVREPSWSHYGDTIAFSGTETYPKQTDDPMSWNQMESLLLYPWDLYLMDADGQNIHTLLPQVGRPYQLKWSPRRANLLAFAGDIYDSKGIWILNSETLELVRIWPQNTYYDWSPDGKQMVVIAKGEAGDTYPIIINVPGEYRQ